MKNKQINNLPAAPADNFIGREIWIQRMRKALYPGRPVTLPQIINAPDGAGKTALAYEYAARYGGEYEIVWWIDAHEPALIKPSFLKLASELEFFVDNHTNLKDVMIAIDSYFKKNTNWLLIFDGVTNSESLRQLIPLKTRGHIIGTTAIREWPNIAEMNDIDVPERVDARAILKGMLPGVAETLLHDLCDRLVYLPLAMKLAAGFINEKNIPPEQYLEAYNRNLFRAMNRDSLLSHRTHPALAAACETTCAEIMRNNSSAQSIINFCSFLAPQDIPLDLLSSLRDRVPPTMKKLFPDDLDAEAAARELDRWGLAAFDGASIRFHSGIQNAVIESLADGDRAAWAAASAAALYKAISDDGTEKDPLTGFDPLTAHALSAARHAAAFDAPGSAAVDILNNTGEYLYIRGDLAEALSVFQTALDLDERTLGGDHPNIAVHLNNIGSVLSARGEFDEARDVLERALEIDMGVFGDNHTTVATDLNTLGGILFDMGYYEAARRNFRQAMNIDRANYGARHPVTASRMKNLGAVLHELGDNIAARTYLEDALEIETGEFGPDSPRIIVCLNYLASVYQALDMFEKARDIYIRVLAIDEASLAPNHPDIGIGLNNLGAVLRAMGDKNGAREQFDRALDICLAQLGRDHPNTLLIKENIDSL